MEIYTDLDGVAADFSNGANDLHGRHGAYVPKWDWYKDWGMTDAQFWAPIRECGADFYTRYVKPYRWMDQLLDELRKFGPLVIVTANPRHGGLMAGKLDWIDKYIGDCEVIYCNNKARLAKPDKILVDDSQENIDKFKAAHGRTVVFPQLWNTARTRCYFRVQHVVDSIKAYLEQEAEYAIV